jgi:hypothetical protein
VPIIQVLGSRSFPAVPQPIGASSMCPRQGHQLSNHTCTGSDRIRSNAADCGLGDTTGCYQLSGTTAQLARGFASPSGSCEQGRTSGPAYRRNSRQHVRRSTAGFPRHWERAAQPIRHLSDGTNPARGVAEVRDYGGTRTHRLVESGGGPKADDHPRAMCRCVDYVRNDRDCSFI